MMDNKESTNPSDNNTEREDTGSEFDPTDIEFDPILTALDNGILFNKICSYMDLLDLESWRLVNQFFHAEATPWLIKKSKIMIKFDHRVIQKPRKAISLLDQMFMELIDVQSGLHHNNFHVVLPTIPSIVEKPIRKFLGRTLIFLQTIGDDVLDLTLEGSTEVLDLHHLFPFLVNLKRITTLTISPFDGIRLDTVAPEQIPDVVLPTVNDVSIDLQFWDLEPPPPYQYEKCRLFVEKLLSRFPSMISLELKDTTQNKDVLTDVFKSINKDSKIVSNMRKIVLELPWWEQDNWDRYKFSEFFPLKTWSKLEYLEILQIDVCIDPNSFYKALGGLSGQLKFLSLNFLGGFKEILDTQTFTRFRFPTFPNLISLKITDETTGSINFLFKSGLNRVEYKKDFPKLKMLELWHLNFDENSDVDTEIDVTETHLFKAFLPRSGERDEVIQISDTVQKLVLGFEWDSTNCERSYCSEAVYNAWTHNVMMAFPKVFEPHFVLTHGNE